MSGDEEVNSEESGTVNPGRIPDNKASRYALQLALQTMRERCQHFQTRLSAVEEENLKLHLERLNCNINETKSDTARLEEQVAQLTRQKTQLTHHIFMVATENKQLWTRLSQLTEKNQSLGSHLTKISETLSNHSAADVTKPNESINIIQSCNREKKETNEESLEEISLKIMNNIKKEKMDLEQQYNQMVELQISTISMEDCEFTLQNSHGLEVEDLESEETEDLLQDIRRISEKLKEEKEMLRLQQEGLKAAFVVLSNAVKNCAPCLTCQKTKQDIPNSPFQPKTGFIPLQFEQQQRQIYEPPLSDMKKEVEEIPVDENSLLNFEDRICPLCSKFYHKTTKFEEFNEHVLSHFPKERDIDSLQGYEFIT
uniref:UBZ1-type domain-containing protein n=2 Tax=Clastoptera arizonana TaxID=38151 RepID=A0A1B6DK04_9HEMI